MGRVHLVSVGFLLDTHIFIWSLTDPDRLAPRHMDIIAGDERTFISIASLWEIAIKESLRKITMPDGYIAGVESSSTTILPIRPAHIECTRTLPFHHRDPFDRMLIAQALVDDLSILSVDRHFSAYDVATI